MELDRDDMRRMMANLDINYMGDIPGVYYVMVASISSGRVGVVDTKMGRFLSKVPWNI